MDDDEVDLSNAELYANDARGVFIPQYFAETIVRQLVSNVTDEEWAIWKLGRIMSGIGKHGQQSVTMPLLPIHTANSGHSTTKTVICGYYQREK